MVVEIILPGFELVTPGLRIQSTSLLRYQGCVYENLSSTIIATLLIIAEKTLIIIAAEKTLLTITAEKTLLIIASEKTLLIITAEKTLLIIAAEKTLLIIAEKYELQT